MPTPKVCVDRLLPRELHRFNPTVRRDGVARAIIVHRKLWINGSELRVRFLGGTAQQQATAMEQAQWWTQHANLRFAFGNWPDAHIRVTFDSTDGAWSYVGTDCREIPTDQPTMNLGFLDGGTAAHEFGHAIGLAHEHQNPAGGIEWNEDVVITDLSGPPNNWDVATIRHNVLNKYGVDQIRGTDFDRDSIMLYPFPSSWTRSGVGTPFNEVLSADDIAFIASNLAYPKAPPVDAAVELSVDAAEPTHAAIGEPGEEDLFQFVVTTGGRHVIETGGRTDVVMRLFGPDSSTDVIATDDDSGVGLNARIVSDLVPGRYVVQVRHFSDTGGKGDYTIGVSRP
jgi:hypothetical protein